MDILLTLTAPILNSKMLKVASKGSFNLHYGILPEFRGNHTLFWALKFHQFNRVGMTIHHLISLQVDGGYMLAQIYPTLARWDYEVTILPKVVSRAPEIVMNLLKVCENGTVPVGRTQTGLWRMYLAKERTMMVDVFYHLSWIFFLNRPKARVASAERFF